MGLRIGETRNLKIGDTGAERMKVLHKTMETLNNHSYHTASEPTKIVSE